MTDLNRYAASMAKLFQEEGLDDVGRLIETPSWEQFPVFSRLHRIRFLDALPAIERGYVLFAFALSHLDEIVRAACGIKDETELANFFAVVTVEDWLDSEMEGEDPTPPLSSFFICTQVNEVMQKGTMTRGARSTHGGVVSGWLRRIGRPERWELAESKLAPDHDPDVRRIYVGHRERPCPPIVTLSDMLADR